MPIFATGSEILPGLFSLDCLPHLCKSLQSCMAAVMWNKSSKIDFDSPGSLYESKQMALCLQQGMPLFTRPWQATHGLTQRAEQDSLARNSSTDVHLWLAGGCGWNSSRLCRLPILLSAVIVFVVSSVLHMVLPYHKNDYRQLPGRGKDPRGVAARRHCSRDFMFFRTARTRR